MSSLCFVNRLLYNWRDAVFPKMSSAADQHPQCVSVHADVIKWKHFLRYWTFVRGIQRSPVISLNRGQWRGALIFFDLRLNKRLSKQSIRRWFETALRSLRRHWKGINVCSPHCDISVVCGRDTIHIHHLISFHFVLELVQIVCRKPLSIYRIICPMHAKLCMMATILAHIQ